ncbi:MAG: PSD1 and planctomycete cytochrome C domain-containing protein [Verrucomicrobiaceae bacterium]|nr:PSD1 and planctomycete cytochrome C domain-containing protein [Verrucomicrobiaceae bacterium]
MFQRAFCLCVIASAPAWARAAASPTDGMEFFEKNVRPVLVTRCYECHSTTKKVKGGLALDTKEATLKGGESGAAVVPGDPEKSRLVEAVRYSNRDLQMPPKGQMPAAEVRVLEQWVKLGAPDPRTAAVAAVGASKAPRVIDIAEGRKFWSFRPVESPALPKTKDTAWIRTPIDAFILAKLEEKGLKPAPPADKRTLIRRATFDLTGLPPTPEDVAAFLADTDTDAFQRVVEHLLASPAYGERWGRHWLDVARYADSNGMDENVALGHAWRYRDYVVKAFNTDKPYDQFLIEQIAGDLLPIEAGVAKLDAVTATGFLSLGAKVLAEPDVRKLEMDIIDEQIDTLGKAFLGMTFGCVRCHDHKFDPVRMDDYYAMAAIFRSTRSLADVRTGAIKYWYEHSLATPQELEAKKKHEAIVAKKRAEVTAFTTKARTELKAELQSGAADYLAAAASLAVDTPFAEVEKLAAQRGLRPRYLLTCRHYLAKNAEHPVFAKWRELAAAGHPAAVKPYYAKLFGDAAKAAADAKAAAASQKTSAAKTAAATKAAKSAVEKPAATPSAGYTISDPALAAADQALNDIAGFLAIPDKNEHAFDSATFSRIEAMNDDLMKLEDQTPDPAAIMGVADGDVSRTLPIHIRGSYLTLGKEIERGFPEVMRVSLTRPVLPAKQSGRLELARWLASGEHPLTARVMVNRIWRWHFGKGIVATTDNFGLLGDKPSHPALLDWLAHDFVEQGWSVKDLHRLIMRSAVYQQASGTAPEAGGTAGPSAAPSPQSAGATLIDPENRLLSRFNIQRLEAEEIRDAMLASAGTLDAAVGGKTIPLRNREFVFNHTSKDHTTYESPRRGLYLPIIRNHLYDMLEQFDYPDPTMPTGSRNSTVVAPQALIMLNSPVAMDAGTAMARRLLAEGHPSGTQLIRRIYQLLYGREASDAEIARAVAFLQRMTTQENRDRERPLALLCHTLMAANEFIYLR